MIVQIKETSVCADLWAGRYGIVLNEFGFENEIEIRIVHKNPMTHFKIYVEPECLEIIS